MIIPLARYGVNIEGISKDVVINDEMHELKKKSFDPENHPGKRGNEKGRSCSPARPQAEHPENGSADEWMKR